MPGNFSTAVNIDHRSSIVWAFVILGALASSVDRRMFNENECVLSLSFGNFTVQ
jgi:hypothetical protein